jgi:hypothetical protein
LLRIQALKEIHLVTLQLMLRATQRGGRDNVILAWHLCSSVLIGG